MNSSKTNKFKVGDKIRRVYVGYYDMPVGSEWIVEKVVNNKEIKLKGSDEVEWLSENFELVSSSTQDIDCNFKVGDLVEFMEYTDESEWESQYGLNVGDMVKVVSVERDSFTVRSKTGYLVWTDPSQVVKCCKDNLEKSEDTSHTNKFKVGDVVKEDSQEVSDNVNSPKHYASQSIECIVAMEAMLSKEEFIGYLRGNIFKYQWRYKQKNGMEDLKKAQWYQSKLIEKEGCL